MSTSTITMDCRVMREWECCPNTIAELWAAPRMLCFKVPKSHVTQVQDLEHN